jgi:hypothetical protein
MLVFGTDRVVGMGQGPFMPLVVDDCVVLNLARKGSGLMVRAFGYDCNDDIAFRVMDNVYEPAAPLQLRPFRPDRSTFMLLDRFDKEVLYVRDLNRHAVRIRGCFLCGEAPQAVTHDNVIQVGGREDRRGVLRPAPHRRPFLRDHKGGRLWYRDRGRTKLT